MNSVARTGRWNPGGGRWLELLPTYSLNSFSPNGLLTPTITLKAGAAWSRIYTSEDTLSFTQTPDRSPNGIVYNIRINGFCPDDDYQRASAFFALMNAKRLLARICDNSGQVLFVGSPVEYLELVAPLQTDQEVSGQRGRLFTVTGTQTKPASYV